MITLELNGTQVEVKAGITLLEAARLVGCSIPTLCHVKGRLPFGACRLCVVEIGDGTRQRLAPACSTRVTESLRVSTESARVVRARKMIVQLLLASCPQAWEVRELAALLDVKGHGFKQEHEAWLSPLCLVPDPP